MIAFTGGPSTTAGAQQLLYIAEDDSQGQTILSDEFPDPTVISEFQFSPDGQFIAYLSEAVPGNTVRQGVILFVQSVDGGTPVLVSQGSTFFRDRVVDFDWSPDSRQLVYSGTFDSIFTRPDATQVYLVDRDGANRQNLSIGAPPFSYGNPQFSPDGRYIIEEVSRISTSGDVAPFAFRLNFIDTNDALPNRTELTAANGSVKNVRWSQNSTSLCFNLNNSASDPNAHNIRISDVSITAPNTTIVSDGSGFDSECRWSADGSVVLYEEGIGAPAVADLETRTFDPTNNALGAPQTVLSQSAQSRGLRSFEWAPGSNDTFAAIANRTSDTLFELFSVANGGAPVRLNAMFPTGTADVLDFKWSPDASRIAYTADADINGVVQLFVANADGANVVEISDFLGPTEEVVSFDWSADGSRLAFSVGEDARTTIADRLYVATADGADLQLISTTLVAQVGALEYAE